MNHLELIYLTLKKFQKYRKSIYTSNIYVQQTWHLKNDSVTQVLSVSVVPNRRFKSRRKRKRRLNKTLK